MIAVCGGKGGVGKSTYSLLLYLREKSLLVDTDCENPSLHLLLKAERGKLFSKVYGKRAEIIEENCKKCGICVKSCKFNAIFMPPSKAPIVVEELCEGCGVCSYLCPYNAIKMVKKEVGEIFFNRNYNLLSGFVHFGGESREVLRSLLAMAEKIDKRAILDCPSGIHCNVIPQLIAADKIYIVTEPTPLGLSGLVESLKTVSELGKSAKVVINKFRRGKISREIVKVAEEFGFEVVEKIPYSRELAKAYAEGRILSYLEGLV